MPLEEKLKVDHTHCPIKVQITQKGHNRNFSVGFYYNFLNKGITTFLFTLFAFQMKHCMNSVENYSIEMLKKIWN